MDRHDMNVDRYEQVTNASYFTHCTAQSTARNMLTSASTRCGDADWILQAQSQYGLNMICLRAIS